MNRQELIQSILITENKIQLHQKELMKHKHYFSHHWNKITYLSLLIIPFSIGIKFGKNNGRRKERISRYIKLITFTIFSNFQNRFLTSVYTHLEQFIKNKLMK